MVLWVFAGVVVVLAVLGFVAMRQRKKNELTSWDVRGERAVSSGDSVARHPRPPGGSWGVLQGGGDSVGDAGGE